MTLKLKLKLLLSSKFKVDVKIDFKDKAEFEVEVEFYVLCWNLNSLVRLLVLKKSLVVMRIWWCPAVVLCTSCLPDTGSSVVKPLSCKIP